MNNEELELLSNKLIDKLDEILDIFSIKYIKFHNRFSFPCPIHGGDNPNGVSIFLSGSKIIGNWKCWTHGCEETYGRGILGFIKGMLSIKDNKEIGFPVVLKWATDFVGDIVIETTDTARYNDFINITDNLNKNPGEITGVITKSEFRKKLLIPADYYLKRGYQTETMNKFDVGLCLDKTNRFFSRVVIPVYDILGKMVIASVARTTQPKCKICNKYHFINRPCPQNDIEELWSQKWLNSAGFRKSEHLYNFWNAKEYIAKTNTVILVEGQGDVWRLHEAGFYNAVGMFGCELSDKQMIILEKSGAMNILTLTDSDAVGIKAREKIYQKCSRLYNVSFIDLPKHDIGEMSIEQIKEILNGPKNISN